MIKNAIGVHPKALLDYGTIGAEMKALIDAKMVGCSSPGESYIQMIVEGVTTLVCSAYPKKIILRLSDSNPDVHEPHRGARQPRQRASRSGTSSSIAKFGKTETDVWVCLL